MRPSDWKVAKVIALYKSGSLAQIDNILQTYLNSPYFVKDLGENSLQAANGSFRASQSTFWVAVCFPSESLNETVAVTYFTDHIRKEADSGKATGAVFIDLSKAFDEGSLIPSVIPFY